MRVACTSAWAGGQNCPSILLVQQGARMSRYWGYWASSALSHQTWSASGTHAHESRVSLRRSTTLQNRSIFPWERNNVFVIIIAAMKYRISQSSSLQIMINNKYSESYGFFLLYYVYFACQWRHPSVLSLLLAFSIWNHVVQQLSTTLFSLLCS